MHILPLPFAEDLRHPETDPSFVGTTQVRAGLDLHTLLLATPRPLHSQASCTRTASLSSQPAAYCISPGSWALLGCWQGWACMRSCWAPMLLHSHTRCMGSLEVSGHLEANQNARYKI